MLKVEHPTDCKKEWVNAEAAEIKPLNTILPTNLVLYLSIPLNLPSFSKSSSWIKFNTFSI
ncbi:hypothetical protein [Wolbachia endosymbiont of Folsomia candida]|uniref:hypothetical protein n=1 Tax=Wolbachia endosymbiont of Folsomia candida TaxID=169402 RepID=UPI0013904893|nr:hypothetical protein [Wolbachia endosymbiont of Folsomia candida]